MSDIPFVLSLDTPAFYNPDIFPNRIYRQLHARHHVPLDLPTLGLIGRLASRGHHPCNQKAAGLPKNDKEGFEVHLDVGSFKPNELSVKVVNDFIVIEGKHEECEDEYGFISRHFVRRYKLPKCSNIDDIVSTLTLDGVLTVRVPNPSVEEKSNEHIIEIKHVGPSDLFLKNNETKDFNQCLKNNETANCPWKNEDGINTEPMKLTGSDCN